MPSPPVIVLIPRSGEECKPEETFGEWLPRACPACGQCAIIGHGRRWRQAHDRMHDWIVVRRGLCKICRKTLTVLPAWCVPRGWYILAARQQAAEQANGAPAEQVVVTCRDANRIPDPSTIRRWLRRRRESLKRVFIGRAQAPTLFSWDWRAASRILIAEDLSP